MTTHVFSCIQMHIYLRERVLRVRHTAATVAHEEARGHQTFALDLHLTAVLEGVAEASEGAGWVECHG